MKFKELKKVLKDYESIELHYTNKLGFYDYIPNYQAGLDSTNKYDEAKVCRVETNQQSQMSIVLRDTTK